MSIRTGSAAVLSGIAVIENVRQPIEGKPLTVYMDAHFFAGPEQPQTTVLLRYYNEKMLDLHDLELNQMFIEAFVCLMHKGIPLHASANIHTEDYAMAGDISIIHGPANEANLLERPSLIIVGPTSNIDRDMASFDITAQQVLAVTGREQEALFPVRATLQDKPKWVKKKPVPSPQTLTFLHGWLMNIVRDPESKLPTSYEMTTPMKFEMDVERIIFLGVSNTRTAAPGDSTAGDARPPDGSKAFKFNMADHAKGSRPSKRMKTDAAKGDSEGGTGQGAESSKSTATGKKPAEK